jgi:hypothetical protein
MISFELDMFSTGELINKIWLHHPVRIDSLFGPILGE